MPRATGSTQLPVSAELCLVVGTKGLSNKGHGALNLKEVDGAGKGHLGKIPLHEA